MPWEAASFKQKHNHSLSSAQATRAAAQANAILRKTGDEGLAIAVANKDVKRAHGGVIPHYDTGGLISGYALGPSGVSYPLMGDVSGDVTLGVSPVQNYSFPVSGSSSAPNSWTNSLFTQTPSATLPGNNTGTVPSSLPALGGAGGGNGVGGVGQPGVGAVPAAGAQFGDPNSTIGQIGFAVGAALMGAPAMALEALGTGINAINSGNIQGPPSIGSVVAQALGLDTPSLTPAQSANQFGETGPSGEAGAPSLSPAGFQAAMQSANDAQMNAEATIGADPGGAATAGTPTGVTSAAGPVGVATSTANSGMGGGATAGAATGQSVGTGVTGSPTGGQDMGGIGQAPAGGGSGGSGGGSGCFLTSAVMREAGKSDSAPELKTLRWFRDNVLMKTPEGRELIRHYYSVAPDIVRSLDKKKNASYVYGQMRKYINQAVEQVHRGNAAGAIHTYGEMLRYAEAHARGPAGHTHMANGGIVPSYDVGGPIGGLVPSAQTMNPIVQNAWGRFSQMSPEQLHELSARVPANSEIGQIINRALQQKEIMPNAQPAQPQQQQQQGQPTQIPQLAILQGQGMQRGGTVPHAASGLSLSQMTPWWARQEERGSTSGLLHSTVAGRTDHINVAPPSGSYVIPADVLSGLGEGNTLAGARVMDDILSSGPYGTRMPRDNVHPHFPAPPRAYVDRAKGGGVKNTRILAAGGEYIVKPRDLVSKFGSVRNGHKVLDKFVVTARKKIASKMQKLPGPEKS
ncbi:MAG: hypothetical protein KGL39_03610 [Patescibacteria group bacterium]|nr:hypothetical protein [Patescibacteria group bacterium]